MPKLIGLGKFSYWSKKEREKNNTPRHALIKKNIYPLAMMDSKELKKQIENFKKYNLEYDWDK